MSNSFSFIGRLARDAEVKSVGSSTVCEFTAATDSGFGEKKSTTWAKCTMWGSRGEKLSQYLLKGKQVFVTGEMSIRDYTKKDGSNGYSVEVNVNQLDFIKGGDSQ